MSQSDLKQELESLISVTLARQGRADLLRPPLFAYAAAADSRFGELKQLVGPWHLLPEEVLPGAVTVICCFVPFTKPVAQAPKGCQQAAPLWGEAYLCLNAAFDQVNAAAEAFLRGRGYACYGVAGTHTYGPRDLRSFWSHRSAAALAGLGVFGQNRLLLTAKGSAGRFCTILTNAPLEPGCVSQPVRCLGEKEGCCGLCFRACPVGALRPQGFDRFLCHDTVLLPNAEHLRELGFCDVCGKCLAACPLAYVE